MNKLKEDALKKRSANELIQPPIELSDEMKRFRDQMVQDVIGGEGEKFVEIVDADETVEDGPEEDGPEEAESFLPTIRAPASLDYA